MLRLLLLAIVTAAVVACGGDGTKTPDPPSEHVYVVDSANGNNTEGNGVIVVDPATRLVVTTIPGTYSPDAVVDPRGSRLFVTRFGDPDLVDVYNTSDWSQAGTFDIDKRFLTLHPPATDWLKVSPDGKLLYYLKYGTSPGGCGDCNSYVAAVDLESGEQALNTFVDGCALSALDLDTVKSLLYTHCSKGQAGLVDLNTGEFTLLPVRESVSISLLDSERDRWYLLSRSLRLHLVDTAGAPDGLSLAEPIELNRDKEPGLQTTTAALSADGSRLYVGVLNGPNEHGGGWANEIWGFDTETMERVNRIELATKAFHFAVSLDGRTIYSVDPDNAGLTFIDIASGEQETMAGVGGYPAKVLVGPK
jgi:hypothetical protein